MTAYLCRKIWISVTLRPYVTSALMKPPARKGLKNRTTLIRKSIHCPGRTVGYWTGVLFYNTNVIGLEELESFRESDLGTGSSQKDFHNFVCNY